MTADQVKAGFKAQGKTQKEWAAERGYKPEQVTRVLNGQWKATRGLGHEIAVALGLKKPTESAKK